MPEVTSGSTGYKQAWLKRYLFHLDCVYCFLTRVFTQFMYLLLLHSSFRAFIIFEFMYSLFFNTCTY